MNGAGKDQNKCFLKFHVTVVDSLIVTTGPCVTLVPYSNSGQPKPQLRGVQGPPPQRNHRGGGRWGCRGGGGAPGEDTMGWGGRGGAGVAALHHKNIYTYKNTQYTALRLSLSLSLSLYLLYLSDLFAYWLAYLFLLTYLLSP